MKNSYMEVVNPAEMFIAVREDTDLSSAKRTNENKDILISLSKKGTIHGFGGIIFEASFWVLTVKHHRIRPIVTRALL